MKPGRLVAVLAVLGMAAFLLWSTLGRQQAQCRVCAAYGGHENCAMASAASVNEATRSAQATACGPIALGMDAAISCQNREPVSVECKNRH